MTRRALALAVVALGAAACALSLDLRLTTAGGGSIAALREAARDALRAVGLPAEGRLELDEVIDLLNRLTPAQEPARGALYRLRRRLEQRAR